MIIDNRYQLYKKSSNILVNNTEILSCFPDYYKTKVLLEDEEFISKEEIDSFFEYNYKKSDLYKKLKKLAMAEEEIYAIMVQNKDNKYFDLKNIFEALKKSAITLCELIDYIGHYPTTYPVAKEEEKNKRLEKLFEKYDIIVRYYLGDDLDSLQIVSDDLVRIIEKLVTDLSLLDTLREKEFEKTWSLTYKKSNEQRISETQEAINRIESFPLSEYQKNNKSRRQEGIK